MVRIIRIQGIMLYGHLDDFFKSNGTPNLHVLSDVTVRLISDFFLAGGLSDRSQWITYKKLFGSEFIDTLMKEWSSDTQQKQ